ncbi:helix-turn-helix transcriptional regulator [Sphingomonas sp. Leaf343]|uniref:helix-turn-helix transcriptional regulator n=1 Tax=Sphingomonas sp. Leaf343 TaxID=1736345 RepID=UPI0006F91BAF|nr:helix-turn-helix transcriptional regulator [Sphingomonas sp. Leaf343]KQR83227.1 hypothetical protein ASG07_09735 [Sphingomonas sp. Leaf343]
MSLSDGTADLVRSIYDTIDDPDRWPAVLDRMISHTNSHLMLVSVVDLRRGHYHDTRWSGPNADRFRDGLHEYDAEMFARDPLLAFGAAHPHAGGVRLRTALVHQGRDPDEDPYARWIGDRLGIADSLVRYTPPIAGLTLGISIHAAAAAGSHAREAIDLFTMLFDHVERAMRTANRPPDFASDAALAIMVGRDGRILRTSPVALALLDRKDGLHRCGDRLVAASLTHTRRLDTAIASALGAVRDGTAGAALALPRPSGRPDLLVRVDPVPNPPSPFRMFGPAALILVTEPDAGGVTLTAARRWAQCFELTPAETRLTVALIEDEGGLRQVADRLGIAYGTVRVQLASVFRKVGVSSQAQLARLLTRIGIWLLTLSLAVQAVGDIA